jgi:hypothetical protein
MDLGGSQIMSRYWIVLPLMVFLLALPQPGRAQGTTYRGEAAAAEVRALFVNVAVSDTGPLPSSGGSLSASLLDVTVPGLVGLHLLNADTTGVDSRTDSQASVALATVTAAGIHITASILTSEASAACQIGHVELSGNSQIAALTVNGVSITVTGEPNQTVPLLVGSLVINEQIASSSTTPFFTSGDMLVNALHLQVLGAVDVVISSSKAGVTCRSVVPL